MKRNRWKHPWECALLLASVLVVIITFLSVACGRQLDLGRKDTSEALAKFALRAYGEAQRAYSHEHYIELRGYGGEESPDYRGSYAKLNGLLNAKFISPEFISHLPADYWFETSITNYSTYTFVNDKYSLNPKSTFTAIAFPVITEPPGYMLTFSIREDRRVRAYLPDIEGQKAWGEDDDYGTRTWTVTD